MSNDRSLAAQVVVGLDKQEEAKMGLKRDQD